MDYSQPPNLVGSPPAHEDKKFAEEQERLRRRREEERKKAMDADLRLRSQQTQQVD
ncbi:hypothetical protein [Lentzea sp. NBRC 102530]|uniref:hypothetical protein n=1 Tax=Lentzea sp. NBRC 102530 TaxID=3032201 RepID=UPI0024A16B28|nr:hypothetical protein [Lentzea sp. NBRC 102530]GLY53116.1 hypothetical protein Lesp01_67720 [Lentzea sp. NBRC 102530]